MKVPTDGLVSDQPPFDAKRMTIQLPPDVERLVAIEMQRGNCFSAGDVLRDALQALADRNDDIAAIAEGIADMEAGRVIPAGEAEAMLRRTLGHRKDAQRRTSLSPAAR